MPYLRERKGNLVFIGSSAGKLPRPGAPVYARSKWWTRGFALSVEAHAGQDSIAVTLINPTAVRSQIWHDELGPGEAAEPEEVADVVAFAAEQEPQTTLSEVDLFRRDLLGKMVPREIDLDLAYDFDRSDRSWHEFSMTSDSSSVAGEWVTYNRHQDVMVTSRRGRLRGIEI